MSFFEIWAESARVASGLFWTALWAFVLGYATSAMIQVFVTRDRMQRAMGDSGAKSLGIATLFGFISSSCSFAALATARALFRKGASFTSSMAFLLASTNLVVELGIVIALFLSWHFVVGEYVGGLLLILTSSALIALAVPRSWIEAARRAGDEKEDHAGEDPKNTGREIPAWRDPDKWNRVGVRYVGEWQMVAKDVLIGFTIAGVLAVAVPTSAFEWLFVGTGDGSPATPLEAVQHALVGPVAAFLTFIGSMGNVPLAGVLHAKGVSIAGVMAFLFSDLVVFPVLRINARYYGWRMALTILAVLFLALFVSSLLVHFGFHAIGQVPVATEGAELGRRDFFALDTTLILDFVALAVSALLAWAWWRNREAGEGHDHGESGWLRRISNTAAVAATGWIAIGLALAVTRPWES